MKRTLVVGALCLASSLASITAAASSARGQRASARSGCHWVGVTQLWTLSHHHPRFTSTYAYVVSRGVVYCVRLGEIEIGGGHWIDDISSNGAVITLEDGSIWRVSPLDVSTTSLWLPVDNITVAHSREPGYPYRLINTDEGETASAQFLASG